MNTLKIEAKLAEKYSYQKLPKDLSGKYKQYFIDNIPDFLSLDGGGKLFTLKGTLICNSYDRIVVGDYGAFIEFSEKPDGIIFSIAPGQEYRIYDKQYSKNVKYEWYTIDDGSKVKIYKQKRRVSYADYKPKKYYVSVHEVMNGN